MQSKIGWLALFCFLFTFSALAAEQDLEDQMRQLSVDVPKQQAELASRLTQTEEELAQLKRQLISVQEQLVKWEANQKASTTQINELQQSVSYLKREVERLQMQGAGQGQNTKLQELEAGLVDLQKASRRNLLIILPVLLGLGIFF